MYKLQVPESIKVLLNELIGEVKQCCISILFTGSWSTSTAGFDSDFDFIFVTKDGKECKNSVIKVINRYKNNFKLIDGSRASLDCKVLTEQEFKTLLRTEKNFYLFLSFKNGITVYGKNYKEEIKLNKFLFITHLENQLKLIEETIELIRKGIMFRVVCFNLFFTLKTFYFADKFLRREKSTHKDKEKLYSVMFGGLKKVVKREAYKLMRSVNLSELSNPQIRVRTKENNKILPYKREKLLNAAIKVHIFARDVYKRAKKQYKISN